MEKTAQDIILRPIVTEKSMSGIAEKKYTFRVANTANKIEIAHAVETLFGVKVLKVNTLHVKGKQKRMGKFSGYTSNWKKAIVTLKPESKNIEFFEGMA
jgi:large subunit ribosomal protein L23